MSGGTGERKPRVIVFGGDGRPMPVPGLDPEAFRVRYVAGGSRKARSVAQAIQAGAVAAVYILTRFVSHSDEGVIWVARGDVPVHRVGPARAGVGGELVRSVGAAPAIEPLCLPEAGQMTDGAVAALHGVDASTVWRYRTRRGIPAFRLGRDYPGAGSTTDAVVAALHGVSAAAVAAYRRRRDIPAFYHGLRGKRRVVVEALQDPGACLLSSRDLAEVCGVSGAMVRKVRREFGVVPGEALSSCRVAQVAATRLQALQESARHPQRDYDLVGAGTDQEVAELYGTSRKSIGEFRRRRGVPVYVTKRKRTVHYPEAGGMPDAQVARIHGVTETTIKRYRRRREIPSWRSWASPTYPAAGTAKDAEVAALYGVDPSTIGRYRRRHGIPRWKGGQE